AVRDRSVRTPTSWFCFSTTEYRYHAEEDPLIGIPRQQPIHQPPARPHDLTGQPHKGIGERLELQTQHPALLGPVLLLPPPRYRWQGQRPPRLQVPRQ